MSADWLAQLAGHWWPLGEMGNRTVRVKGPELCQQVLGPRVLSRGHQNMHFRNQKRAGRGLQGRENLEGDTQSCGAGRVGVGEGRHAT